VNQKTASGQAELGTVKIAADQAVTITLSNRGTDGFVIADGVQLLPR
jgi:hypothetical protein